MANDKLKHEFIGTEVFFFCSDVENEALTYFQNLGDSYND